MDRCLTMQQTHGLPKQSTISLLFFFPLLMGSASGQTNLASGPTASAARQWTLSDTPADVASVSVTEGSVLTAVGNGPVTVSGLLCNPTTVPSGGNSTCTVTLSQAASNGGASVA